MLENQNIILHLYNYVGPNNCTHGEKYERIKFKFKIAFGPTHKIIKQQYSKNTSFDFGKKFYKDVYIGLGFLKYCDRTTYYCFIQ